MHLIKYINQIILLLLISFTGYITGLLVNEFIISDFFKGESRLSYLLYHPSFEYIYIRDLLNSSNELLRLSAYYALFEYGRIDEDILIDRYKNEKSDYIKRTSIWMMGYSNDMEKIKRFFSMEYSRANYRIKREMLRSLKRLDVDTLNIFIKDLNIDNKILKGI